MNGARKTFFSREIFNRIILTVDALASKCCESIWLVSSIAKEDTYSPLFYCPLHSACVFTADVSPWTISGGRSSHRGILIITRPQQCLTREITASMAPPRCSRIPRHRLCHHRKSILRHNRHIHKSNLKRKQRTMLYSQ